MSNTNEITSKNRFRAASKNRLSAKINTRSHTKVVPLPIEIGETYLTTFAKPDRFKVNNIVTVKVKNKPDAIVGYIGTYLDFQHLGDRILIYPNLLRPVKKRENVEWWTRK